MTGRRIRTLLLVAALGGLGYWIYKDRPTVSGIVDTLTSPLMGSKAAVKSSERNRVVGEASTALSEQNESTAIATLREGMTIAEVRDVLGNPDAIEKERQNGIERQRWTYAKIGRILIFQEGRVASIVIR